MRVAAYCFITNNINNKPWPKINFKDDEVDWFMITDQANGETERDGWKIIEVPTETKDMAKEDINKFNKWNPFKLFPDYDYSLYFDSKVELLKSPLEIVNEFKDKMPWGFVTHKYDYSPPKFPKYKFNYRGVYAHIDYLLGVGVGNKENLKYWKTKLKLKGFPENTGLPETAIILTDLHSEYAQLIQKNIYRKYKEVGTLRDQPIIPYVLWIMGIPLDEITLMGKYSSSPYGKNNKNTNVNNRVYSKRPKVVVTMTSWKKRIDSVLSVVKSIMNNTVKPDVLYLNLSKSEFKNMELPKELVDYFESDPRLIINWVKGKNTKSMKKVFPILQYLDDDDIIITADDDILFPEDLIESRINDFNRNDGKYSITSSRKLMGTLRNMYVASAVSLYTKRMFNNWKEYVNDEIIKTYNDDRTYLYILYLNGFYNKPCRKYSVRELLDKYSLNLEYGMSENNTHIKGRNYDKIAINRLKEITNLPIGKLFGFFHKKQ